MARPVISDPKRHTVLDPLYNIDPQTGASVEIFYADRALATSFGARDAGWFVWSCRAGSLPDGLPTGPFATSYSAFREAAYFAPQAPSFGRRTVSEQLANRHR